MGAGHDGAAKELRKRLEAAGHRVEVIDFLDAVAFHIGPALRWFYQVQLKLFPWSYELSYKAAALLRAPTVMVDTWLTRRKLRRAIKQFRPDAIVSVYPLASLVLGRMRRKKTLRVPVVTYLTDFAVHSLWVHPGVDGHLAVSELSAAGRDGARRSRRASARPARGRPVPRRRRRPHRGAQRPRASIRRTAPCWWWPDRGASATWSPPSRRSGAAASSTPSRCAGATRSCAPSSRPDGYGTVIGWTDDMPALMAASDAFVENAGGLTCMEAFSIGLPVITYLPIAGHGKDNAEMMSRAGVNGYARDERQLHELLSAVTVPGDGARPAGARRARPLHR